MNRPILHVTGCCLVLILAACHGGQEAAQPPAAPAPPSSAPSPMLGVGDQAFIAKAAGDNAFQIMIARLALQKSQNADVRTLAQRVIDDHTRMNSELTKIDANRDTDHPSPPVSVDKTRQVQTHLAALQGNAFEQAFAGVMVKDHHTAIDLFSSETKNGHDEAVRKFARKELPSLREHLAMAEALSREPAQAASR